MLKIYIQKQIKLVLGLTKMQPQDYLYSMEKILCKFTFYFILRPFFQEEWIEIVPINHVNCNYAVHFCRKKPFSMSYRSLLWVDSPWLTKMQPQDDLYSIEKTLCKYIFYFIYPGLFCSSEALLYQPPLSHGPADIGRQVNRVI